MTLEQLAELVKRVRDAQRAYFKTRGQAELVTSKELERRLDKEVDKILAAQRGLFG